MSKIEGHNHVRTGRSLSYIITFCQTLTIFICKVFISLRAGIDRILNKNAITPKPQLFCHQSGFTLVELLLTCAILAYAISAMLATYTGSSAMAESSRNLTTATSHASYVLEDIRNTLFSSISSNISSGTWNFTSSQVSSRGLTPLNNETISTVNLGGSNNPLNIQVTVSWNDSQSRSKTVVLTTMVGG